MLPALKGVSLARAESSTGGYGHKYLEDSLTTYPFNKITTVCFTIVLRVLLYNNLHFRVSKTRIVSDMGGAQTVK